MKKSIISICVASLAVAMVGTAAQAGFGGGASPFGQNPDQYLTIAYREQLKRLKRAGKIRSVYQFTANPLVAAEEEAYQERYDRRHKISTYSEKRRKHR